MRYCSECGKKIKDNSKFCTFCGAQVESIEQVQVTTPVPISPEVIREFNRDDFSDSAFKLMEPGRLFNGYTVIRLLNKDPEGIKYIAEKNGKRFVLKLFFKYEFSNLDKIIGLQTRLKRLNTLQTAHTARVVEINQTHDPAYMASEYVGGESLARIKANTPDQLDEAKARRIAIQLVETAMAVRKQGLSLVKLTLSGIMLSETEEITVLSSGIRYEDTDEREEVFNIGVILAQLLSRNVLYKSIYNTERLQEQKFNYLPGVTVHLNKILSDCLHRNILQRYISLDALLATLKHLPEITESDIHNLLDDDQENYSIPETPPPVPKSRIEWSFILVIVLILAGVVGAYFFLYPKISKTGNPVEDIAALFTPREIQPSVLTENQPREANTSTSDRNSSPGRKTTPLVGADSNKPSPVPKRKPSAPQITATPIPSTFVRVPSGALGFNRSKENPNPNVTINTFYISKYELTQGEWNQYMMPANVSHAGDNLPLDNVSWMQIILYCIARSKAEGLTPAYSIEGNVTCDLTANGYRLPTEAEWEMAAKAGQFYDYSGSDNANEVSWNWENSRGRYYTIGSKNSNDFGIYDMTGNVSEWCWDWYNAKYPNNLPKFDNPTGPSSGSERVIRGGSIRNGAGTNLNLLYRQRGNPNYKYQYVGCRLVRSH